MFAAGGSVIAVIIVRECLFVKTVNGHILIYILHLYAPRVRMCAIEIYLYVTFHANNKYFYTYADVVNLFE